MSCNQMHVFVTKVEVTVSSDHVHSVDRWPDSPLFSGANDHKSIAFVREYMESMPFVNDRSEVVHIGMSKDVQETIGLSFKALKEARTKIDEYHAQLCGLNRRFRALSGQWNEEVRMRQLREERLSNLTLWERIRILFGADVKQIIDREHTLV